MSLDKEYGPIGQPTDDDFVIESLPPDPSRRGVLIRGGNIAAAFAFIKAVAPVAGFLGGVEVGKNANRISRQEFEEAKRKATIFGALSAELFIASEEGQINALEAAYSGIAGGGLGTTATLLEATKRQLRDNPDRVLNWLVNSSEEKNTKPTVTFRTKSERMAHVVAFLKDNNIQPGGPIMPTQLYLLAYAFANIQLPLPDIASSPTPKETIPLQPDQAFVDLENLLSIAAAMNIAETTDEVSRDQKLESLTKKMEKIAAEHLNLTQGDMPNEDFGDKVLLRLLQVAAGEK